MKTKNIRSIAVALGLLLVGVMPMTALAAVPTIANVSPSAVVTGNGAFTLTVNGTNFDNNSMVNVNGSARTTTYVSPTQVTASIPAADLTAVGTLNVTVANPGTGGGTSNTASLTVGNTVPVITSISPTSTASGSGALTLTVNGSNFTSGSMVRVNGSNRTTTHVSANQLTASIPVADLVSAGTLSITVANPTPGGGISNAQNFTVTGTATNPIPMISSISPASVVAGNGAFTLTISGSNFNTSSVVKFNGINKATTFVSGALVTATIPAADVAMTGSHIVNVVNPAPGGGTSNSILFTIAPTTGTPQLPDTGFGPAEESSAAGLMAAVIVMLATIGTALIVRRARLAK